MSDFEKMAEMHAWEMLTKDVVAMREAARARIAELEAEVKGYRKELEAIRLTNFDAREELQKVEKLAHAILWPAPEGGDGE